MKVRHKQFGTVLELAGMGYTGETTKPIYCFQDGNVCTWDYASEYEPIPEETWEDVTKYCEIRVTGGVLAPIQLYHNDLLASPRGAYRVRKVQMFKEIVNPPYTEASWAFIVEKRS